MTSATTSATLRPLRGADAFWRGLYGISHDGVEHVVEVDYFDIGEKVRLYRDGVLADEQRSPAAFDVSGGTIHAAMALYGMKRIELVAKPSGQRSMLAPLPGTAEAKRLGFAQAHPLLNAAFAAIAWVVLAIALMTQIPNLLNGIGHWLGFAVPTFDLPGWLNGTLSVLGIAAGLDRALRMKHNPLLDD